MAPRLIRYARHPKASAINNSLRAFSGPPSACFPPPVVLFRGTRLTKSFIKRESPLSTWQTNDAGEKSLLRDPSVIEIPKAWQILHSSASVCNMWAQISPLVHRSENWDLLIGPKHLYQHKTSRALTSFEMFKIVITQGKFKI